MTVVATFSILGDLVQQVAQGSADVMVIVGPHGDPHTFEPQPDQIRTLTDADMIFEIGIGFEPWLDDIYEASGSSAQRVVVSNGIALLTLDEADEHEAEESHSNDDGHDDGEHDPHIWQDVSNTIAMVGAVRDALSAADPANAVAYATNADAYIAALTALDTSIRSQVESIPAEDRILVTSHDSLGYLAHAYGFTIAGTALGSLSTAAADPSAGEIAELIEQIQATGVPAIFAESSENADLMQQIADDAGVELAPPLYTDTLTEPNGDAPTYIDLMTWNVTTIVTALGEAAA